MQSEWQAETLFRIRSFLSAQRAILKQNFRSLVWYLRSYREFRNYLRKKYSINDLAILNFFNWHHGAYYFKGKIRENFVFIKTDFEFNLLNNEVLALQLLNQKIPGLVPELIISETETHFPFVALKFVEIFSLEKYFDSDSPEKEKEAILWKMIFILDNLRELGIVHRDIRKENFLLEIPSKESTISLKLIDFVFSIGIGPSIEKFNDLVDTPENREILRYLGEGNQPEPFVWNDAFALKNMMDDLIPDFQSRYPELCANLIIKIRQNSYQWPGARNSQLAE